MKNANGRYWFKRRRYGYGWIPVTWEGWVVIVSFFVAVAGSGFFLLRDTPKNTYTPEVGVYLALVLMLIVVLVGISARKGPKPKWRWGKKDKDDPEQDF